MRSNEVLEQELIVLFVFENQVVATAFGQVDELCSSNALQNFNEHSNALTNVE